MVTRRERGSTECERVTYGAPGGPMTLEESEVVWWMPGTNYQITRTLREPLKASLIHFSLGEKHPEGRGVGTESFRSASSKPGGWWLEFALRWRAHLSAYFLALGPSSSVSSVQQGAWPQLPFLGLCTFNQFWAAPFQIGLFMFDIKNSCWPISSFHRCSLGLNPSSLSDAH